MAFWLKNKATGVKTPVDIDVPEGSALVTEDDSVRTEAADTLLTVAESPEMAAMKAQLEASNKMIADLHAAQRKTQVDAITSAAKAHAASLVKAGKLLPAGVEGLATLHALAGLQAANLPTEGLSLSAAITSLESGLVSHKMTAPAIADATAESLGLIAMPNGSQGTEADKDEAIRARNDRYFGKLGVQAANGQSH